MVLSSFRRAVTIIELLIVLALLAIIGTVAFTNRSVGSAHRDASSLARALTSARWLAVGTGEPVSLVANGDVLHVVVGAPTRCEREPIGAPAWELSPFGSWRWPTMGLAFGAHGWPLRCDASAVGNTTIALSGRDGSEAAVVIASLGRVRWERR